MQGLPYVPTVVCLLFKVVNNSPRAFPPRPAPPRVPSAQSGKWGPHGGFEKLQRSSTI